jgi:long-chain fatty acid transport protein
MRLCNLLVALVLCWPASLLLSETAHGQSYGVDLKNSLMPASGAMGGTSVARPQDFISGINGNAATLTQYRGTNFTIGSAWAEATMNIDQTGNVPLPGITPFAAKSQTPGSAVPNVGVAQELTAYGLPVTLGMALVGAAGAGTDFRQVSESNGTSMYLSILEFAPSAAVQLTERLSVGSTFFVGSGFLDGPFVGDGAMTNAYGLRGSLGMSYDLTDDTTLGAYYQTRQHFRFEDAVRLELLNGQFEASRDVELELPRSVGLGVANSGFMDGDLLLAADVLYMNWADADLFRDVYRDQWVLQLGSQYQLTKRCKLRAGYALAQNPIDSSTGTSLAGIPIPGGVPGVKYLQAQLAVVGEHRISGGVGFSDVLPGVDFDVMAGGMFPASEQLGANTAVNLESYWAGMGLTWRFGRGACAAE